MRLLTRGPGTDVGTAVIDTFGGLDAGEGAKDGAFAEMRNGSSRAFPLFSSRPSREKVGTLVAPDGIGAYDGLFYIDGGVLHFADHAPAALPSAGKKICAALGKDLVIFPDKVVYRIDDGTTEQMEKSWTGDASIGDVTVDDVTYKNCAFKADNTEVDFAKYFRAGDAVTISGCAQDANNKTAIIRAIDHHVMRFSENCFEPVANQTIQTMTVKREVPDMDFLLVNENRLWGCKDDTIYASALGDVYNFNVFDGVETDSYAVDTGTAGSFTGAVSFMGYPVFFKEDRVFKVYGNRPSNFEVMGAATVGVKSGCSGSLAVAGEVLYYVSPSGVMAYTGGFPTLVSEKLGVASFTDAVGGSDGYRYYLSANADGEQELFVFDALHGIWSCEDETAAEGFACVSGDLYMLDEKGGLYKTTGGDETVFWMAETTDFIMGDVAKKRIVKIRLRFTLANDAEVRVYIRYDRADDWGLVRRITDGDDLRVYELPVIPHRCDSFRLHFEGAGGFRLHTMAIDYAVSTAARSRQGRY